MSETSPLWLVDRSRIVDGRGFCQRARYLNYHAGPNGYGITMKATRLPLMTGIASHDGLAPILEWCRQHPLHITTPPDQVIRDAVKAAQATYWQVVKARGFAYLEETEEVRTVTREQTYLIEGMIWAWCLAVLPEILQRAQIIEVEVDDTYVVGCSCGLGDGTLTKADHEGRGCQGIGLMCRPDFLALTRLTQELEYHEFKTTSMDSITFRDKWEVMIQLFAATLDAERRLQKHVQSIYVHGLIKGKRGGEYNPDTGKYDGTVRQNSIFCYAYKKPAVPPMEQEEWAAEYNYIDEYGKNRRLGKAFQKVGVWELPDAVISATLETPDWEAQGVTRGEFWAKWIPEAARRKNLLLLGPFTRQSQMVEHFVQEMIGEEEGWQAGLWRLHDCATALLMEGIDGDYWRDVWPHPEYQYLLDRTFPRSYECRRYGGRNRCQFETICFEREGFQDPMGSGKYIARRPHHRDELEQAIGRGLLLPEEGLAEEQEMELP